MTQSEIRKIVAEANDRWNAAFNRGDADAVAALYTADGVVLPPTHAVVKGAAAIKEFWYGLISVGVKDHGIGLLDAEAADDIAYATGKWWATGQGQGGQTQRYEGWSSLSSARQSDGSWKARLHTWN